MIAIVPVTAEIEIEKTTLPSYGYRLKEGEIKGFCDGKSAVIQSIYKRLMTEKYAHEIYSSNYGIRTEDIMGGSADYAVAVIEERIREALAEDDRIESVYNFEISRLKDSISVKFEVMTIFGSGEVEITDFMKGGDL